MYCPMVLIIPFGPGPNRMMAKPPYKKPRMRPTATAFRRKTSTFEWSQAYSRPSWLPWSLHCISFDSRTRVLPLTLLNDRLALWLTRDNWRHLGTCWGLTGKRQCWLEQFDKLKVSKWACHHKSQMFTTPVPLRWSGELQ